MIYLASDLELDFPSFPGDSPLLVFDGECMMCNSFIIFIDSNLRFHPFYAYSSVASFLTSCSQSTVPPIVLSKLQSLDSILVFNDGLMYCKSSAISFLLSHCKPYYMRLLAKAIRLFNLFGFSDFCYSFIAPRRHYISRLFSSSCRLNFESIRLLA